MLVYIAGPIRGTPNYNSLAFHQAQIYLERLGHEVINPLQLDLYYDGEVNAKDQWEYAARDTGIVLGLFGAYKGRRIEAVYALAGWSNSIGSRAEVSLAQWIGAKIITEDPSETTAIINVEKETENE